MLEPLFFTVLKFLQKYFIKGKISANSLTILHEVSRPIVLLVIARFLRRALPLLQLGGWNALLVTGLKIAETSPLWPPRSAHF